MDKEQLQAQLNLVESARTEIEQAHTDMVSGLAVIDNAIEEIYGMMAEDEALAEEENEEEEQ